MDEKGQAITMEALIAVILLISIISFIYISMPTNKIITNQQSQQQLREYGRNFLFTSTYPVLEQGEIAYELMREYSPRKKNTTGDTAGNKWNFDSINSENITKIEYSGTNYDWTSHHLIIDHDDEIWPDNHTENLSINYLVRYHPTDEFVYPKNNGTLYQMLPFAENGKPDVREFNNNSISVNEEGKEDGSVSMIWYETNNRETSNPSIIWTDKTLNEHDEVIEFNKNESDGAVNKTTKLAKLTQNQSVIVYKTDPSGQIHIYGPNNTSIMGEGSEKGVEIIDLGKEDGSKKYKITFKEPAKGAYSIHQGPGRQGSSDRSDPVFVMVGEPKLVGEFSYLKALAFGEISLSRYKDVMESSLPDNVGYSFEVLDSSGDVFVNDEGETLSISNGPISSDSVSVDRVLFVENQDGDYEICEVRLVLWYR